MKRVFDVLFSSMMLILCAVPMLLAAFAIRFTSPGPVIFWSDRVGRNNELFRMPKFRTMRNDTPPIATHLLPAAHNFLTPVGGFLRKTSLDEMPQLWSILKGDMSVVGPRPALFNQDDLVALRSKKGVDKLLPGLTGWAQINGRDELPIPEKVKFDEEYLQKQSFFFDLKVIFMTFLTVAFRNGISH